MSERADGMDGAIAIVGMAGRFPRSADLAAFWRNLCAGVEGVSFFTDEELLAAGVEAASLADPAYVRARALLEDFAAFDAAFFGVGPREAEITGPQHRLFLECCWQAFEAAGYDPARVPGAIGVFASASSSPYLYDLYAHPELLRRLGAFRVHIANEKEFLPSWVSYKLDLRGPSVNVQTACSSSLVAVHLACQSLLNGECDMALAGGVSVRNLVKSGYVYKEGGILSPDGHCRAFSAAAAGTLDGDGVGVVVLKRLDDALAGGDFISAVIRGSAVNNDGAAKVGYTAPGLAGQAGVIAEALSIAGVEPATLGYIEAHGTGTRLGDPIEIAALTDAFRARTAARGFCAVGSVKTNIGHLDAAAGIAGLIKAALALQHGRIPPSLHCAVPNPEIDFAASPFYVNRELTEWGGGEEPRRAGVSSFGIGGTNAHVVLEQAPSVTSGPSRPWQLLVWSARSEPALAAATSELAGFFASGGGGELADAAFTLQNGRRGFPYRRALVCHEGAEAAGPLLRHDPWRRLAGPPAAGARPVAFLFPGQGAQRVGATAELYVGEEVFRAEVDRCARLLEPHLGADLRAVLYPAGEDREAAERRLAETRWTQPAMFVVAYALSRLWMSWGVRPQALLGHSVGEYVAACLAGAIELSDALVLVAERARLMQALPAGGMLALPLSEEEITPWLGGELALAAVNGPRRTVVSGPFPALDALEERLAARSVKGRRLLTSHAFHSPMMAPAAARLATRPSAVREPGIPYLSVLTGDWITPADLADPSYWSRHMCSTVRFADAAGRLLAQRDWALLEVGPGRTLSALLERHPARREEHAIVPSLPATAAAEQALLLEALGHLWIAGVEVDWAGFSRGERRRRVALPTYPFERQHYLIARRPPAADTPPPEPAASVEPVPPPPAAATPRRAAILQVLKELVHDLTGTAAEQIDPGLSFLDAGVDSLLLIQASQQLQERLGVKLSLVQLLEELPTLDDVARHLEGELTAESLATLPPAAPPLPVPARVEPAAPPSPETPAAENAAGPAAVVERILAQQLDLMAQQLQVLRGMGGPSGAPSPFPVTPEAAVAPSPAVATPEAPAAAAFGRFGPYQPLDVGQQAGLTLGQSAYLAGFVQRYTARTAGSKGLARRHRPALADGRASVGFRRLWKELVYPIHGGRSRGARLWDVDGNEYLDVCMGFGLHFFGHSPAFVTAALQRQLEEGIEVGPQSPLAGRAAELIRTLAGVERVAFCNSGTEAIMGALRVARTATRRNKVVLFSGSYHGWFDGTMARGQMRRGERVTVPAAPGVSPQSLGDVVVLDYDSEESLELLEKLGGDLAAVLVEPVRSRSPEIQPRRFLQRLREITSRSGALLIFDEMVTGFRIHPGGAQAWFGVEADLVTYGKMVAAGLPIGVLAGRAAPMDVLDGGAWEFGDDSYPRADKTMFAGSFFKHPLVMAAAVAVLERLRDEGPALQARLNERTARMVAELNAAIVATGVPLELVSFGALFRFRFAPELPYADLFPYHLLERGIFYSLESGNCFLTPAHDDADVARLQQAVLDSVRALQEGGFLPPPPAGAGGRPEGDTGTPAAAWREIPTTEPQHALWVVSQLEPDASRAYNEPIVFRLRGPLDVGAMGRALQAVVDRHAALRATLADEGRRWRIAPALRAEIAVTDLAVTAAAERAASTWLVGQAGEPFDLERGPLFRCGVARLGEGDHYLALTLHHLVIDGPASSVLLRELRDLYAAEVAGRPCVLPPAQELDAARPGAPSEAELSVAEAYWTALFAPPVPFLELPADRPRKGLARYAGARCSLALDLPLFARLRALGAGERATPFMTLLAACGALLHRWTGQADLPLGVPLRDPLAGGAAVGYFTNLMPLRLRAEPTASFRAYLGEVKRSLLAAQQHRAYPFARLLDKLHTPENAGRALVAATFNFDRGGDPPSFPGLAAEMVRVYPGVSKFDLAWNLTEERTALLVECDFRSDQFDPPTVERLLRRFAVLLSSLLASPDAPLGELAWLGEVERHQLIEWNATAVRHAGEPLLHRRIEAQVARTPEATAVVFEGEEWSYAALNLRANRLARHLRRLGVGPDVPVAVCMERSPEMVVALLAVLKAGGAYIPLDPTYPQERLAFMLGDGLAGVAAPVLLTQERLAGRWAGPVGDRSLPPRLAVLPLEAVEASLAGGDGAASDLAASPAPDHLAYVIYTSGSTGQPKGAMNTHRAICNRLLWMQEAYGLTARDRVLQKTPLSFDVSVWELFWPLLTGAALVLARPEGNKDAAYLVDLIAKQGITTSHFVPSLLNAFLEEPDLDRCASLRRVIASGEALSPELQRRFFTRLAGLPVALHNLYGPTEAAVDVTFHACSPGSERTVPIGRPIDNLEIHLLDAAGQPVPAGVAGELQIGGLGLARGYLHRPRLTAEKFVPHPCGGRAGERLYRTGDLARFQPNGAIEYLGRLDHQVKIRGFRIELDEIAVVLACHPEVREAAVLVREERPGDRRLVACIVPRGAAIPPEDLRAFMGARLPEHMVPAFFVALPALPLLPNGKLDRRALAATLPAGLAPERPAAMAAPRTPAEEALAVIWREVLHRDSIGIDENFFALGGDSILSIQIVSRARRAGLRLIPRQLFEHPTIAALAAVAEREPGSPAEVGPVSGPVPWTPIQHWFFAQALAHPERFNHALLLAVEEEVGISALARAVELLQAHHDALRLRFASQPPAVHAGLEAVSPLAHVDLSALPEGRRASGLEEAADALQGSLDLRAGPLCRWTLFTAGPHLRPRLLAIVHHLVTDGVSWRILLEDLEALCRQLTAGGEVALPPRTTSYQRWAEHLLAHARSAAVLAEAGAWRGRLSRAPAPLPVDRASGPGTVGSARHLISGLDREETRALLEDLPRTQRTRINDVLLAALVEACARWTGSRRLLVDLEGHGREEIADDMDLSRTVGWFTAIYPVLLDLEGIAESAAALAAIGEQLRAFPGRSLGYGLLRFLAGEESAAALGALPRAEILFNYLGQLDGASAGSGLFRPAAGAVGEGRHRLQARSHLLEVNASVRGGCLQVLWTYSEDRHARTTVERLSTGFLASLRVLLACCRAAAPSAWSPADFQLAGLDRPALDRLLAVAGGEVEDVYPASPLQQGMIFQTLRALEAGVYVEQVSLALGGELDLPAFEEAWRRLAGRHAILRTAFLPTTAEGMHQVVRPRVELHWEHQDWRGLSAVEQVNRLETLLAEDRRRGFDLDRAPLMRFALLRLAEERYRFVWSFHHVLLDGWSLPLLLRELSALYEAVRSGEEAQLAPVRPYRDYIAWLTGQDLGASEEFWRRLLRGFTAPTPLAIARATSLAADSSYGAAAASLSPDETATLRAGARLHQLTFNSLVQGAWALLLHRYSRSDDVVFGVVASGRSAPLAGIEEIVGLFINTLPARVRFAPRVALAAWLATLQRSQVESRQHEFSPLSRVREWSEIPAGLPLFASILAFENYPVGESLHQRAGGLAVVSAEVLEQTNYPLSLVAMAKHSLDLKILYDARLFAGEDIARLTGHLKTLLQGMSASFSRPVGDLPFLTASERRQLEAERSSAPLSAPPAPNLHRWFEAQVERSPEAVAVVDGEDSLTYGELNARSNRLARYLGDRGVGPDVPVALCVERSIAMIVGVLGILKAGGAYVPLEPSSPRERLAFVLADSLGTAMTRLLLTHHGLATALLADGEIALPPRLQVVDLDAEQGAIARESAGNLPVEAPEESLAYVIYTSGTTGRPKGTLVTHHNVLRLFAATEGWFGFHAEEVWSMFHSFAFDFSVWELWGALLYGGRLVVVPYWVSRSPDDFHRLLIRERVTILNQTPSAFRQLILADERADANARAALALRLVVFGGEALDLASLEGWWARHPEAAPRLINMYGITETTVHVSYCPLGRDDLREPQVSPIGQAIPDLSLHLLDPWLDPAPEGVPGEIHVGGAGLARGYLGRPDLTAERFVPDLFARESGARLYRTGDLARRRPNGGLEFLGRADSQVKIRGFRIELGEVEAALSRHPAIRDRVVVAGRDRSGAMRLVAYLVPGPEGLPPLDEMRAFLLHHLPEPMIPAAFVPLAELPLTSQGKLDRGALPEPEAERSGLAGLFAPPQTLREKALAEIWAAALGVDRVGRDDNFFSLGGDSIRSLKVLAQARERGIELSIEQIFRHQTVSRLAAALDGQGRSSQFAWTAPLSLVPEGERRSLLPDTEDAYPLSRLQAGMIFHSSFHSGSAVYHDIFSVHLQAPFDDRRLRQAADAVTTRHPVLRTSFDLTGFSEPLQVVHRRVAADLTVDDIGHLAPAEQESFLASWVEAEKARPFDLALAPLTRLRVHRRSDQEFQLTLSFHHAILDGWSVGLLLTELLRTYLSLLKGEEAPQAPLPLTFRDFVALELAALEDNDSRRYWTATVAGSEISPLPRWDRALVPPGKRRGVHQTAFPPDLCQRLHELARTSGIPLKSFLLAVHCRVLSALLGEREVVTGLVANGRSEEAGGDQVLGLFLNTLPFRLGLPGGTWSELVGSTFEAELALLPHRRYPMAELQRETGGLPLFEATFNFVHFHVYQNLAGDREIRPLSGRFFEETDLTFMASFSQDVSAAGLHLRVEYAGDEFSPTQVAGIAACYERALAALGGSPEASHETFSVLTAEEIRELLIARMGKAVEAPTAFHRLFERQVRRRPAGVALLGRGGSLVYAELNDRANRLAHRLRRLGVGPDVPVGICTERSFAMVCAVLAVLKAGGAFVPLDPAYPRERLALLLADAFRGCNTPVVLTQQGVESRLPARPPFRLLWLDTDWEEIALESGDDLAGDPAPDDLAYVIYTSGSTGRPKGVGVPHRGLGNLALAQARRFAVEPGSRVLQFSSPSFDAAVSEIAVTLAAGATLCMAERAELLPGPDLFAVLRDLEVCTVTLPPSILAALPTGNLPALRTLVVAGETCPLELARRWGRGRCLINAYGPTEATVCASAAVFPAAGDHLPLGQPLDNLRLYVLDEWLNPVPAGGTGEVWIAGMGLARGYLGRPDLTAEAFWPDLLNGGAVEAGSRMYRSGDLARCLPGGGLEFVGRRGRQVKIRGFRIEPEEIESALLAHPGVSEAAVVAREDGEGGRRLLAFVVPRAAGGVAAGELREFLRGKLPQHMVPSEVAFLESFPRTVSGKLDRQTLPVPDLHAEAPADAWLPPRTPVEELIAGTFAEVLRRQRVGIAEDFFALGGHSLLATRAVSRLAEVFAVHLPVRAIFDAPTVETLAASLERILRTDAREQPPRIEPIDRSGALPLSFAQQRLWFLDRLTPGSPVYNIPVAVRLRGPLDPVAFAASLTEIARRHEVLRTSFRDELGEPMQVVAAAVPLPLPVVDLKALPVAARSSELTLLASAEARRPFDLVRGPLMRATLLMLDEEEHALLLTLHHIVSDGWSMGVMVRELGVLYTASSRRLPSPLPELEIQYADFAAWQRRWLQGEALAAELAWWRGRLLGMPPMLELPLDNPRPAVRATRGGVRSFQLSEELSRALFALSARRGATPFMALLAAFWALLARYSGQDDFAVGTPIAGRNHRQIEELIGFFVNTLVLRANLAAEDDFGGLLAQARRSTLDAYTHQELPFERLVEELRLPRDLGHTPLFQVMFAFDNAPAGELTIPGLALARLPLDGGIAKFDLGFTLGATEGRFGGSLAWAADLFDPPTIDRLLAHFTVLLAGLTDDPERPFRDAPLLTPGERHALCREWNDTAAGASGRAVHALIAAQAARTPDAVAVVAAEERLTFRQLRARTVRLASRLRRLGVGPETPVGLLLARSLHLPVAILAVLEAGGAYVPLDPAHPRERQEVVLADAGVRLLLTAGRDDASLPSGAFSPLDLDQDDGWGPDGEGLPPAPSAVAPESVAYILYTSGSTGRPKGIMVPHRGLANYLAWCVDAYAVAVGDGALVHSSVAFDLTITSLFAPLLAGRAVHLLAEDDGVEALGQALRAGHGLSLVKITPAHLEVLCRSLHGADLTGAVGTLVVGGEALLWESLVTWRAVAPSALLVNEYGPTETVVGCCVHAVAPGETGAGAVPIGRPIANARLHVFDARGHEVPVGVTGELYVGGPGVARGYVGRPDLTAERFLPNPFADEPGARLYRTGDRVRRLPNGDLEFHGRLDRQVKIRGFRIELGEIESTLTGLPGVVEAVVEVWEPAPGDRRLVAYVVTMDGEGPAMGDLAADLRQRLPEPMVPSLFLRLVALPLTANGKVDRRALPAPEASWPAQERPIVPPRTPVERTLVALWEDLLNVRPIGIRDSFFELGGHSLLAVRAMAQIQHRFGRDLPLATLFAGPTVEQLARCLAADEMAAPGSPLVPLQTAGAGTPFFCVHPIGGAVQGYLHLARHLGTGQPFYALQAPDLESVAGGTHTEIEEIAAAYLHAVRLVQPRGPYRLGGWSFGGTVAFEMARQLAAQGEEVALLALIDTPAPAWADAPLSDFAVLSTGLARDQARQMGREWTLAADGLRSLSRDEQVEQLLAEMRRLAMVGPEIDVAWLGRFLDGLLARMSALQRYTAREFAGRITLFRASEIDPEDLEGSSPARRMQIADPALGWGRLATGGVDVHHVPGYHATMTLEPHVQDLARALAGYLTRTEPGPARFAEAIAGPAEPTTASELDWRGR